MITFTVALAALIAGYFIYGKFVSRVFGVDPKRATPAYTKQDGVDYIPMPAWKIFMIQFLNIAGLGPIFGAIMGAKFGTASYLWIVLGSIFAGAVHDFLSGMISLRNDGESLPETIGRYLGSRFKQFMRIFSVLLMVLVGAVFVAGPAGLLAKLTPDSLDRIRLLRTGHAAADRQDHRQDLSAVRHRTDIHGCRNTRHAFLASSLPARTDRRRG